MIHQLKAWPESFQPLWDGEKTAEFRRDDRGFAVGDHLDLFEWEPGAGRYTGRCVSGLISHIARAGGPGGIPEGYCMASLKRMTRLHGHPSPDLE